MQRSPLFVRRPRVPSVDARLLQTVQGGAKHHKQQQQQQKVNKRSHSVLTWKTTESQKVKVLRSEVYIVQNRSMHKKKKEKKGKRLSPGRRRRQRAAQLSRSISSDGIIIIQSRAALTGNPSYSNGVNEQHEAGLRSEGVNGRSNMLQGERNAFVPYTFSFFFSGHSCP